MNQKENNENNEKNSIKNDNKQKNNLIEKKILTDDEGNFINRSIPLKMDKINKMNNNNNNLQNKEIIINENKKYKTNKILGNIYLIDNKPKIYYGYDERHNLEDTINNHAYYESVHSKKKINNLSFNKDV